MVGGDAEAAQRDGHPGGEIGGRHACQHYAERGHQEAGGHQPAAVRAVGIGAEQGLHHAGKAGGCQHQAAHGRVAVAALQHHEGQQGRHQPLIEIVDRVRAGEQSEPLLVHAASPVRQAGRGEGANNGMSGSSLTFEWKIVDSPRKLVSRGNHKIRREIDKRALSQ